MLSKKIILESLRRNKVDSEKLGINRIGLFGSSLKGDQTETSDIDLMVDFKEEAESFDNLMEVCHLFEKLFTNQKLDIVTKNGLSPHIGPRILIEVQYV
jgi:predicted nucleotidyltransferase